MSEPINNPTPAPAPEPAPEKTFTQAEVDTLIGKRLAKAMKGMPSEEEMTAFRTWKINRTTPHGLLPCDYDFFIPIHINLPLQGGVLYVRRRFHRH